MKPNPWCAIESKRKEKKKPISGVYNVCFDELYSTETSQTESKKKRKLMFEGRGKKIRLPGTHFEYLDRALNFGPLR